MRALLLLTIIALTGCTYSRVTVTTVVVKVDSKKDGSPSIKGSDIDIVPRILKALPETEDAAKEYTERGGAGNY